MIIENVDSTKEELDINFNQGDVWEIEKSMLDLLKNATITTQQGKFTDNVILKWSTNFDDPNEKLVKNILNSQIVNLFILFRGYRKDWVSDEIMDKHYIRDYQINMINKIYLNYEFDEYGYEISLSHTRPFGNTNTWSDFATEIIKCDKIYGDYTIEKELEIYDLDDQLFTEMEKLNNILIDLVREYPVPHKLFSVVLNKEWHLEKSPEDFIRSDIKNDYIIPMTPKTYFQPSIIEIREKNIKELEKNK